VGISLERLYPDFLNPFPQGRLKKGGGNQKPPGNMPAVWFQAAKKEVSGGEFRPNICTETA